jgi:glycosidase
LYLNPIVEARSNHRYDTSDYLRVDPILGSNADLVRLCEAGKRLGIRVMLDGVFSHTGADSRYFNRYGSYPDRGAFQGKDSPYYPWYDFRSFPQEYRCWWGFKDLPEVDECNAVWQNFVVTGRDSVVRTWLRRGASGWRLDVADELPDEVLALIRKAAKAEKPDAVILGEVWEDAVIKESYGGRRHYALGESLDSVMNYPFRSVVLRFAHGWLDAYKLRDFLIGQQMNYPKPLYYSLMNLLGSHDVERLRSALASDRVIKDYSREEQKQMHFSHEALEHAVVLEKLCSAIQFAIPGVPSIYYGDEQGMQGVGDPFNRGPFREERQDLHDWYAELAKRRNDSVALSTGEARFFAASADVLLILRYTRGRKDAFGHTADNRAWLIAVNRGKEPMRFTLDCRMADRGLYHGQIAAETAEFIEL